ncbi:hypothetical protein POPTR_006G076350v4 [Populus trichocarpa]|uniref:Uncharacterized protein n=1 Tax=Populus trichocarpa TaxID=3694 RepID=A0ACC0SSW1_POPTR|nr:hypothetical protein POPTR_006G076350v4 [Populus trichocarpa]
MSITIIARFQHLLKVLRVYAAAWKLRGMKTSRKFTIEMEQSREAIPCNAA